MGCGCKNVKKIEDKYGVKKTRHLGGKIVDFGIKMVLFSITIVLALVIVPIVLVIGLFKAFFTKDKTIRIPEFLTKNKKSING